MAFFLRSVSILCLVLLSFNGWLSDSSACPPSGVDSFIHGVRLQCPVWIERFQREEVISLIFSDFFVGLIDLGIWILFEILFDFEWLLKGGTFL